LSELVVVTPSYGPDAELFADLHRSVLQYTSERTVHHVIVPSSDRGMFDRHAGPRCKVWTYSELLPRRYLALLRTGVRLNARRPWPPVRGWVLQQAVKIAAAARFGGPVLLADSDVVLVRETTADKFRVGGRLGLYRADGAVHAGMPRHVRWHTVAEQLLGLPPAGGPPLPDYVSPFNVWDPEIVRAMQARITKVTGRDWMDAFTSRLHISEFILYGVFVDRVLGASPPSPSDSMFCHTYWETTPLDEREALAFAGRMPDDTLAMMISAKSGTPHDVRTSATRACNPQGGH
jgi:hypothetical protein